MKKNIKLSLFCFTLLSSLALVVVNAQAKCKKMGFLVNDYGKDGPSKDAQDLLEKHVAKWATENKISKYTIGKKEVSCELFLNFIVFDEHTCTASANVCWDETNNGSKNKTPASSKSQEANNKQTITKTSDKPSEENSSTNEPKSATTEPTSTNDKSSEAITPNSNGSSPPASTEVSSKKESVQTKASEETQTGSNGNAPAAATSEEASKKLDESKAAEACAEKKLTPPITKVKSSEPVKPKAKPPTPKKPSPSETTDAETTEEASNEEGGEAPPSDIETGSLPFFSIEKDNQPEYSRNPLNQNF